MNQHLSPETLSRLVDEAASPAEAEHLSDCTRCTTTLDELRRQTEALGALPELLPPMDDWDVLEARLRSEGLVRDPGLLDRLALVQTPTWMRVAAAVLLFMAGTGLGTLLDAPGAPGTGAMARTDEGASAQVASVEEAASEVQAAEERYVAALTRYRSLLADEGEAPSGGDPASRFAALEYLVAAGQAAVRQAPADPFLNGLLASTLAERDAVLSSFASDEDNWF